ncbi:MAG: tripartite tricarboxylate transporter substrate binding protein [Burkholderiaceae bacterium]|nr:tripartite tricarboxylate transporter substrate binding protein [Burkholderiaceae bacterium]
MKASHTRRVLLAQAAAAVAALSGLPAAQAQAPAYPSKPIRLVVPFNAGGATDILARTLADKIAPKLGQPVLVENRGGASGIAGSEVVAKAAPDGYTLLLSLTTSMLTNQFLFEKLPYNPQRDFALVSLLAYGPVVLVAHPSVPANTGPELLDYIARNKGKLAYGSWGVGSTAHLVGAFMSQSLKADMSHVAYKGEAPMLQDLIGGQTQIAISSAMGAKAHIESGKLKAIGVTGEQRMPVLPNVPTLSEQGLKDDVYRVVGWLGLAAPAKTPPEIVQRIAAEMAAAMALPDVRERVSAMGFPPAGTTPEQFNAVYQRDLPVWQNLVKLSGAKLD